MIQFVFFMLVMSVFIIYLITKSIMPKNLGRIQKFILISLEFILSIMIPFSVYRLFLITYPEHYEAAFLGGLISAFFSFITIPIYAGIFVFINKFFKKVTITRVLYSILILLVGVCIQAGLIFVIEKPYIIDSWGW